MIRYLFWTILYLGLSSSLLAQEQKRLSYSVSANFTIPSVKGINSDYSTLPGYGFGLNVLYQLKNETWALNNKYQYNRYFYFNSNGSSNLSVGSYEVYLGVQKRFRKVSGIDFFTDLVPSYSIVRRSSLGFVSGGNPNSNNYSKPISGLANEFDLGLNFGIGFKLVSGIRLEASYLIQPRAKDAQGYIDSKSSAFKLGIQFTIGQTFLETPVKKLAAEELTKLSTDTLYVINRTCSDYMSDSLLENLFRIHYTFSAFRVISIEEVDALKATRQVYFFAIVGKYYAGLGEPESEGIFLLDGNFNLCEYPYPVHTNYPRSGGDCFDELSNSISTIRSFNQRILSRS